MLRRHPPLYCTPPPSSLCYLWQFPKEWRRRRRRIAAATTAAAKADPSERSPLKGKMSEPVAPVGTVPAKMTRDDDEAGCLANCKKNLQLPDRDPSISVEFAQERWDAIGDFGCCTYQHPDAGIACCKGKKCGTFFPTFCPQAIQAPCCALAFTVSKMHHEEVEDSFCGRTCGLGKKGLGVGTALLFPVLLGGFPPGVPVQFSCIGALLTTFQRKKIIEKFELKDSPSPVKTCLCYSCALWRHNVFLNEMSNHVKSSKTPVTVN